VIWAIIPAAGSGQRSGSEVPKQYRELLGKPMIEYAMDVLAQHPDVVGLVLALASDDVRWNGVSHWRGKPLRTCIGGAQRSMSVLAGIKALADLPAQDSWALVHDAARPCLRAEDLHRLIESACAHPVGGLLAGRMKDTVKRADNDAQVTGTIDRTVLWRAYTPQLFPMRSLERALQHAHQEQAGITDESSAMERLGLSPLLVEGADDNIKVTLPEDFAMAEAILAARSNA
jgi:2-C-methyl-D-erythritol 4-phosphate cytidylyltransferase